MAKTATAIFFFIFVLINNKHTIPGNISFKQNVHEFKSEVSLKKNVCETCQ